MNTIENDLIYKFKNHSHIQLTSCKNRVVNTKTGIELTITTNSRSIGVWIGRVFIPISKFDDLTELIKADSKGSDDLNRLISQLRND